MAKLTVKNVGPIREAEIEVKKHTVFIGPQGSGKSTLAKLIAIGGDESTALHSNTETKVIEEKYNISGYLNQTSGFEFVDINHSVTFKNNFSVDIYPSISTTKVNYDKNMLQVALSRLSKLEEQTSSLLHNEVTIEQQIAIGELISDFNKMKVGYHKEVFKKVFIFDSIYVPAERSLTASLSNAIWSLLYSDTNLPKSLTLYGRQFEEARNDQNKLNVPFLHISYERRNGQDFVEHQPGQFINLSQSASGYQSIIPLLLVVEHQRRQSQRRFIIEEPELNLYPTAQKDLIYSLISGLDPAVEYKDAEWVITTHSPYVLTSFNTLMLAYKVAHKSEELRTEVEKIIPSRCWINPNEFAAYYVDNGTVRNIISEKTGMISDNELDDVSDDLADEQDKLFALSRSVSRA